MKNKWLLLSLCAGYSFALCAQNPENDPVLMKVNGKSIKKSEFEYIYKKIISNRQIQNRWMNIWNCLKTTS